VLVLYWVCLFGVIGVMQVWWLGGVGLFGIGFNLFGVWCWGVGLGVVGGVFLCCLMCWWY